ncbi:MAG: phosphoserine phosphatase SerB [Corynebacterium sp.]|nr:phosphoserine phosphatase SerB [Corynebacterium sp.]
MNENLRIQPATSHLIVAQAPVIESSVCDRIIAEVTTLLAEPVSITQTAEPTEHYPLTVIEIGLDLAQAGLPEPESQVRERAEARLRELTEELHVDLALVPAGLDRVARKLLIMDCDSTLIQAEVIDELAAFAGRGEEVAAITEAAMRGELDFAGSLRKRVATLEGLSDEIFRQVADSIRFTDGALNLIATFNRLGWPSGVVSGGFVQVVDTLQERAGITYSLANTLEVVDGTLTGRVIGEIIDKTVKERFLREIVARENIPLEHVIAVGDGANDSLMTQAAGLGVAFMAKPALKAVTDTSLNFSRLDAILPLAGPIAGVAATPAANGPIAGVAAGPTADALTR